MSPAVSSLGAGFLRLDSLLEHAVALVEACHPEGEVDPFAGLHIHPAALRRLFAQQPGSPTFWTSQDSRPRLDAELIPQFAKLARAFQLDSFDLDSLLIALAPDFDLRYERIYAYLQDDVTRKRPSVDAALNLLCNTAAEKSLCLARFTHTAPLVKSGLVKLLSDPHQLSAPLLAHSLRVDERAVSWLFGQEVLDPSLGACCRCVEPNVDSNQLVIGDDKLNALLSLAQRSVATGESLKLYFHGRKGAGKRSTAEAIAKDVGLQLLMTDLPSLAGGSDDFDERCRRFGREAWFQRAMPFIQRVDAVAPENHARELRSLRTLVESFPGIVILAGDEPGWIDRSGMSDTIPVAFGVPEYADRRVLWLRNLGVGAESFANSELDALAHSFRLTPGQIDRACESARAQARWQNATAAHADVSPRLPDLVNAARAQSGHALARLARKITPKYRWTDIVLPDDQKAQLREMCQQFTYRRTVYGEWGFDRKLSLGKGLNALFSGPPGTGKTMAAEVIATELGLDLYKIDLSQVVSKYIGETEKNLDRIFTAADDANAILFFDEADALFGKRSEVKDAHDRYANIEVGYLLQKMEEHEGITILATNLRAHLDEAFVRRMQTIVEFPFPDEEFRRRIWNVLFPREAPLGEDVDFGILAREVRLAGGSIKNIGLASAFYAASDGGTIRMPHLLHAVQREHQKLGRAWLGLKGAEP